MVTATPNTLGDVLGQIVQAAADAAAAVPQDLQNVFDQAGRTVADVVDEAQDLPADALAQLKQLIDPPDWASLLIFILVKISDLDPAHLSVGSMRPDGWSRTLTLTYTLEPGKTVTVGFAMTDPAPAKRGFILQSTAGLATGDLPIGPLTFSVSSSGEASWRMAFSGALEAPAQQASIDVRLFWDPKINVGDATAGIGLGVLGLTAALSTNPGVPLYTLTLGLGDGAARPGAEAKLDLSKLLGALGSIVNITAIDESYSPALTLTQGLAPKFDLGHKSQP
jgi:hypothetical protein